MATVLLLNDTQVFPDSSQNIKLTKENPYFTQSENYTLDVTIPMEILENRNFFRNICRPERSKSVEPMTCRLLVDNRIVLAGTAKVTQVTEQQVKVQLLGGRSRVNFMSENSKEYIDELPLGTIARGSTTVSSGVRVAVSPVYDETAGGGGAGTYQYCLIDMAVKILEYYGFTVTSNAVDVVPWNKLYVASSKQTRDASHTLPHWTPREFFTEFCNFFNVSLDTDEINKTVAIVRTPAYFAGRQRVTLEPIDEYTSEMGEEGHALASDTLSFDMSGSDAHDYDVLSDSIRENADAVQYASLQAAQDAYSSMEASQRSRQIFRTPVGDYTDWEHDYSDWGQTEPEKKFTQIDVFAPLKRNGGGETQLKICPVAVRMGEFTSQFGTGSNAHTYTTRMFLPSLENPSGNDTRISITSTGNFGGNHANQQSEELGPTIQECVEGDGSIEKAEKEDRLQVMFIDDVEQTYSRVDSLQPDTYAELTHIVGFTDIQYKRSHHGSVHESWSLSLKPTGTTHYLGQLHVNGFSFDVKVKYTFKFLSKQMPDPRDIFIIRGKRYGCEKIEASVSVDGFDELMTGYFYEMTD